MDKPIKGLEMRANINQTGIYKIFSFVNLIFSENQTLFPHISILKKNDFWLFSKLIIKMDQIIIHEKFDEIN